MNKLQKILQKFTRKERDLVEAIFQKIKQGDFRGVTVKKLAGVGNVYRIRKQRIRIIYRTDPSGFIEIVSIGYRDEKTYKNLP